jgi:hypothetical protein
MDSRIARALDEVPEVEAGVAALRAIFLPSMAGISTLPGCRRIFKSAI